VNLRILLLLLAPNLPMVASGQGVPPIGVWREHLPFNNALQVSVDDNIIQCATPYGFFRFNSGDGSFSRMTKVTGLSEVRVRRMTREPSGKRLVLVYENGNVDLLEGNRVRNIPDLMISTVPGDKTCHSVLWYGNEIMLSTGLGIVVLNPDKREVMDTWKPSSQGAGNIVFDLSRNSDSLFAATAEGIKTAAVRGFDLVDHKSWMPVKGADLPAGPTTMLEMIGSTILTVVRDTLYMRVDGKWILLLAGKSIQGLDVTDGQFLVSHSGPGVAGILRYDARGRLLASVEHSELSVPKQAAVQGSSIWVADQNNGLIRLSNGKSERIFPNSPINTSAGDMMIFKGEVWAAAGAVNEAWNYLYNPNGVYRLQETGWYNINLYVRPQLDSLLDLVSLAGDPVSGHVYAGSFGGGLLEISPDDKLRIYKQGTGLQQTTGDPGSYRVAGLAMDPEGTLWISNYGAPQNLVAKKKDGTWIRFTIPFLHTENAVSQIAIDEFGYKWIVSPKGNGLFCLDDRGTPDNMSDDRWRFFRQGAGQGNLPSSTVHCIAIDRDGFLWVGTSKGIGVIQCLEDPFAVGCDAYLPVVQFDRFAGFLFGDEEVRTIAVDGANRKWVGTKNGVWLLGPDGSKIIHRFTERNSPLINDFIHRIAVDPATGEVFISTFDGICSFRSTATQAGNDGGSVLVFPNPVPPGFTGSIAIRGLMRDAIVKITEPDGRLVHQTRALGGQAVWDGRNYRGERVSSGAYLVIAMDEQGRETIVTKIFIVR
jgi:ligand-binding sensor domain-containing protein